MENPNQAIMPLIIIGGGRDREVVPVAGEGGLELVTRKVVEVIEAQDGTGTNDTVVEKRFSLLDLI